MRIRLFLGILLLCALRSAQQPITFQYLYDDIGELIKVIDSTGVSIEYVYDPVGNMLQINRSSLNGSALTIFNVSPQQPDRREFGKTDGYRNVCL